MWQMCMYLMSPGRPTDIGLQLSKAAILVAGFFPVTLFSSPLLSLGDNT